MLLCQLKAENGPLVPAACLLRMIFQHLIQPPDWCP